MNGQTFSVADHDVLSPGGALTRPPRRDGAPAPSGAVQERVLARVRQTAPRPRDRFAWMRPQSSGFSVFVPVLMGAGFVLSGLAWLVERLAHSTARPVLEDRLATRLAVVSLPKDHLVGAIERRSH